MKLDWAILSNAAEVQGGLAYVLGGGWDTGVRQQFPAPLMGVLCIRLLMHRSEAERPHQVEVRVWSADGRDIVPPVTIGMSPSGDPPPDHPAGWDIGALMTIGMQGLPIPAAGHYSIEILVDDNHLRSLPFRMNQAPPAAPPAQPAGAGPAEPPA